MPWVPIRELFPHPLEPFKSRPKPTPVVPQCQCKWQYRDKKGQLQGDFTSQQMAVWFDHGMLPPDLQLRRTTDVSFALMSQYFPTPLLPFRSQPVDPHGPIGQQVQPKPAQPAQPAPTP